MRKIALTILRAIERVMVFSTHVNTALGWGSCILLFLMMFYVVTGVTGRYLFSRPMPGIVEIGETVLAFAIFLSLAHVLILNEHVRVTVVFDRLPRQWRAWLEILAYAIGFSLMLGMTWQTYNASIYSYNVLEYAGRGGGATFPLPLYPAKFACFVGCTLLCIQFFIELLSRIFARLAGKTAAIGEKS